MNAVVKLSSEPQSVTQTIASRYGMTAQNFESTLRATVVPRDCTKEQFAAFLLVANQYGLNPVTREIFAFPKQGGGIQPIVSVDGWANLINSHPQADGFEFTDELDDKGNLVAVTCKMFRKDRSHATTATEYMAECKRDTSVWKQWPRRMLRHKALIQAARYAFGFAGIVDVDEAERETDTHYPQDMTARLVPPPAPPSQEYEDWISESYDELAACTTAKAVEDLRERAMTMLRGEHVQAWKDACADKATELFAGTP